VMTKYDQIGTTAESVDRVRSDRNDCRRRVLGGSMTSSVEVKRVSQAVVVVVVC